MKQRKHIRVFCHGPIAAGAHYESPWEDLHYSWKVRPGRPAQMSGCCVESMPDAENELRFARELEDAHPELFAGEYAKAKDIAERATAGGMAVNDWNASFPNITMNAPTVTRAVAEQAMTWALVEHHGLKPPFRFKWNRPEVLVIPVSF